MTFLYLLETKTAHKEVIIPFLDFPVFNKNKRTKISFILKLTKEQLISCAKTKDHYNLRSWVPQLSAFNFVFKIFVGVPLSGP